MIKNSLNVILLSAILLSCTHQQTTKVIEPQSTQQSTPGKVINAALASEWRTLNPENTLYMTLDSGQVIIELMPLLAPGHAENTKALVREGVFNGTNFYRVLDGFVAQGGPLYPSEADKKPLTSGQYNIAAEFTSVADISDYYTLFDTRDNFADETGFIDGFAVGKDHSTGESWLLHCYGALAMGRSNDLNSGGTALYIVNGPAQRYLDRNTTVFGRVIVGMEHIQALKRSSNLQGPVDLTGDNMIREIKVAADLPDDEIHKLQVLDSQSDTFKRLLAARKNRTGDWFIFQHDYMDACGVPIPLKLQTEG